MASMTNSKQQRSKPNFPKPQLAKKLTQQLVAWYEASHRDLPWRNTRDPYEVWVSEIMLQQTQVDTVIPYYHRFLKQFPTIEALALAPQDLVLKQWEGLGYYARARNLQKAAQTILQKHKGVFPKKSDAVEALCGIGKSTAGAILTFSYGKPHPILDGNVKRVLSRLIAEKRPVDDKAVVELLWQVSAQLLPKQAEVAYCLNQALMELGATCCTPRNPKCDVCPWVTDCKAYQEQLQEHIPQKGKKLVQPHYTIAVGVVFNHKNQILIAQRPEQGLLGGLWEFPGGKCLPNETLAQCVERELLEETGLSVKVESQIESVKHAYTHFKITMHAFRCSVISGKAQPKASQKIKWVSSDALSEFAFPKANLKIIESLKQSNFEQPVLL